MNKSQQFSIFQHSVTNMVVFCSVVGRILLTNLESLAVLTVASILLDVWELFLRITVRQRESMFKLIYEQVWRMCRSDPSKEMKDEKHMLFIRMHFIILEVVVENCSTKFH